GAVDQRGHHGARPRRHPGHRVGAEPARGARHPASTAFSRHLAGDRFTKILSRECAENTAFSLTASCAGIMSAPTVQGEHTRTAELAQIIETAFENRAEINFATRGEVRDAVETALNLLDSGQARVAEKIDGEWQVNQWLKRAVLLSFRL